MVINMWFENIGRGVFQVGDVENIIVEGDIHTCVIYGICV